MRRHALEILVKRHGDETPTLATMRANELLADDEVDGRAVCLRILDAVGALLAKGPEEAVH